MEENNNKQNIENIHDFLTIGDLKRFNKNMDSIEATTSGKKEKVPEVNENVDEQPFDATKFDVMSTDPKELDQDVLNQLADIIDKKTHYSVNELSESNDVGPNTIDRILNAIVAVYVLDRGMPVGVSILTDPTIENYKGIIPGDYYELKTGKSLENRLQQEFFAVKPEYHNKGIAQELKNKLQEISEHMFVINKTSDVETSTGLAKNGYKLLGQFNTDWESEPIELWIN